MEDSLLSAWSVSERRLTRGIVVEARTDGRFEIQLGDGDRSSLLLADQLVASENPILLRVGDPVLCWVEDEGDAQALILGRVGAPPLESAAQQIDRSSANSTPQTVPPDALVLEAKHSLTLRVGDGSITIREDGKILIKGKDLVSHAQRMNRIKGGAVSIN